MAGLVRLRCRQVEKRRPEVHRRWLLPVQFPYAGAARLAARPETADAYEFAFVFQRSPARQITPPVSKHLWHSFDQGRLPRQRPAQAKPVHRPSEPPSKGEMAAAVDDGTSRRGTPWPVVTSASRLVVSVRGCLLESIRGRHYNDESGALPSRFIGQSLAGLDDGIGIDRLTFVTRGTIFRMFGKVQDLLTGDSSTDARRYRRRRMPSARRRASAPRRPVERALRGILTCCVKREF